jgi:peptidoglycan/LPS O-acetylase OafA/YrhL
MTSDTAMHARGAHPISFRKDIEGLRAIAILLVVGAHAGVPQLAGGFVGVDVFFVLSGYLITSLLLDEFRRTGRIDLLSFYARRFQRLLPALLLTVVCTCAAAYVLLAPFEQVEQASAAGMVVAWASNFFYAFQKLDYFGSAAKTSLFLHTWSLGVEEQFYLLWPGLMLLLLWPWAASGDAERIHRLQLGMAGVVVASLVTGAVLTYVHPEFGFYLVISRAWEFALGALVLLASPTRSGKTGANANWLAGWAGLAMVVAVGFLLDGYRPYPGTWALLPAIGTAAALNAGKGPQTIRSVSTMLSIGPLQFIGRLSYAWYLWHWPVLLLGQTVFGESLPVNLALATAALAMAWLSYRYVESPLRKASALRNHPRLLLLAGILAIFATFAASREWRDAARSWARDPAQLPVSKIRHDRPVIYRLHCDEAYHNPRVKICAFGSPDARHTAVLMGDSISGQWFPAVEDIFVGAGWRLLVINKSACPMVDVPVFYEWIGREYWECEQWRKSAIGALPSLRPDVVLIGSRGVYPLTAQQWREGTERVLRSISAATHHIGVLQPTPLIPFDPVLCIDRARWRPRAIPVPAQCTSPASSPEQDEVRQALATAIQHVPDAHLIDLTEDICPHGLCTPRRDHLLVYRDAHHLTPSFVLALAGRLRDSLRESGLAPSDDIPESSSDQ